MSMSLPAPKPLSLSTSPSTGPAAARAAAQDAQITQLVQQVRTLEHTITQLRAQLEAEKTRGTNAVNQIRERWRAESEEWRDGCDALQSKHRLAHLGTRVALEHERWLRLEDREALVREKVARLLREHKITLFRARETDLVAQVAMLEEEIEIQREGLGQVIDQHEAEVARLTTKLAKSDVLRHERAKELGDFTQEKKVLETELTTLRASATSSAKQIERLSLQVETLRTQNTASEDRNKELQHQVDKWQSLEGKGEKEVVELRKRRIDLEVRVKELEVSLKETRSFDKKIAKLEASLLETQEQVEQGNQEIVESQADAEEARKQTAKLEKQIEKLQVALRAEKVRSAEARHLSKPSSSKGHPQVPSDIQEVSENSDDEIVEVSAKPPSHRQKLVSARSEMIKGKAKPVRHNAREAETDRGKAHNKGKGKPKRNVNREEGGEEGDISEEEKEEGEVSEVEVDAEVQELPPQSEMNRRLRDEALESDTEEVLPLTQKKPGSKYSQRPPIDDRKSAKNPRSKTGKAKENDTDEVNEQENLPRKRSRSKPVSVSSDPNGKKYPVETIDPEGEDEQPQKRKKRKLNLTGGSGIFSGPASFTWDQDVPGDLGIPSELSPVKAGQPVPARSGSSSLLGGWKLWKS